MIIKTMKYTLVLTVILVPLIQGVSHPSVNNTYEDYSEGGDNWTEHECIHGKRQSPIDIETKYVEHVHHIYTTSYFPDVTEGTIHYESSELEVEYESGQIVYHSEEEDSLWKTAQFHFHSPSEHTIDGKQFDLEMHSVLDKEKESEQLLVLAILFELDEDAEDLDFITSLHLEEIKDENKKEIENVPLHKIIEAVSSKTKYNYQGSLTTPPCLEIVEWFIVKEPFQINAKQLQYFRELWPENIDFAQGHGNNRNIKAHNRRLVIGTRSDDSTYFFWVMIGFLISISVICLVSVILICLLWRARNQSKKEKEMTECDYPLMDLTNGHK